jgi:hypothetical protein
MRSQNYLPFVSSYVHRRFFGRSILISFFVFCIALRFFVFVLFSFFVLFLMLPMSQDFSLGVLKTFIFNNKSMHVNIKFSKNNHWVTLADFGYQSLGPLPFLSPKIFKSFAFWACLMKVIPESLRAHYIWISEHNLLIEKGRHLNIQREQRLCSHCKCIDDEKHFLLHCTINSELRSSFLNMLNNENQIFNNLSESEKLSYILNPSTPSQVNKKKSLEPRTGDS